MKFLLIVVAALTLSACESDLAPSGSQMTVFPATVDLEVSQAGQNTFIMFVVEVRDVNNTPLQDVSVKTQSFLFSVVNEDGELVAPGTPVTFKTTDEGIVKVFIKIPLAQELTETLNFQSGAISTSVTITDSAGA